MAQTPAVSSLTTRTFEIPPGVAPTGADYAAWGAVVATVAAWPVAEPGQPLLQRRLARAGRRGPLRELVRGRIADPLGFVSAPEAERDLGELLRPLRRVRALRPLPPAVAERLDGPLPYVAELRELDAVIPEGRHALPALFADLSAGLEELPGPVALDLSVAPAPSDEEAEDAEDDRRLRRVRFCLRLEATVPLPAALRARAEALCLARRATAEAWSLGERPEAAGPLALPGVAAIILALPRHTGTRAAAVEGRPHSGPLPATGAVLGRVRRSDGRLAGWRLPWEERRHHTFVAGASGCGKSTALLRLMLDDLGAGRMVVLIDPHGDLAGTVAAAAGTRGVARIDPRRARSAPLDLLDPDPGRAAAHLMSAVAEVWPADFAGPVWQRGISLSLRALAARPGARATLADLERYLVDPAWRASILRELPAGTLRTEAAHEAAAWAAKPSGDSSTVTWLAGKLTALTAGPAARLFARAPEHTLERQLRHARAALIALPLGELGTDTVGLAGRMTLTRLTTALAAQGTLPEAERRPVSIVIDEAHLLAGPALAALFAQARKFHAAVTVATQSPSQLGRHLPGVLTNAQTLLLGRLPSVETGPLESRTGAGTLAALPTLPRRHLVAVTEDHDPSLPPLVLRPAPLPPTPGAGTAGDGGAS